MSPPKVVEHHHYHHNVQPRVYTEARILPPRVYTEERIYRAPPVYGFYDNPSTATKLGVHDFTSGTGRGATVMLVHGERR